MKFKIPAEWLIGTDRELLEKYLLDQISQLSISCIDLNSVRAEDKEITYGTAARNAQMTVIFILLHTLVSPKEYPKPWLLRTRITAPLEIIDFKEYIAEVRNWLSQQAPTTFYGSLVYIQSLTLLLSTMEITNDAT